MQLNRSPPASAPQIGASLPVRVQLLSELYLAPPPKNVALLSRKMLLAGSVAESWFRYWCLPGWRGGGDDAELGRAGIDRGIHSLVRLAGPVTNNELRRSDGVFEAPSFISPSLGPGRKECWLRSCGALLAPPHAPREMEQTWAARSLLSPAGSGPRSPRPGGPRPHQSRRR